MLNALAREIVSRRSALTKRGNRLTRRAAVRTVPPRGQRAIDPFMKTIRNPAVRSILVAIILIATWGLTGCKSGELATATSAARAETRSTELRATDLRCEYLVDPVAIDEPAPRLSWQLVGDPAVRGQVQTGYRLLVASSPTALTNNRGDLWDSEAASSATTQIVYAGRPLAAEQVAYWKVQVIDSEQHRSAWSKPARWSMGLLKPDAWRAEWIGIDQVRPSGATWLPPAQKGRTYLPVTQLRKDFTLAAAPARAVLYVTALGNVEPRLNGKRVAAEYFTPGWTDYAKRLYYRAYDVTALLKPGANTFGALLADGWFRGNVGAFGQNRYGKHTRLRAELHVFDAAGGSQVIATDNSWKASTGPILEADQQAGESYDARLEQPGWDAPGFDDRGWFAVETGAEFTPAILRSHPAPPVRRISERPTVAVTQPKPGTYVFDLGQNFAGFARLKVNEPADTMITLRFAEMLQTDGTVYTEALRTARVIDSYVCKGGGEEMWEPRFTFHGFRYVQVTGLTKPPPAATITGVVLSTGNADSGAFESSDALLNQIWSNTWWSQLSNYLEVPTDCPQRDERLGWTGDAQVFVRSGAYNQDIAAFLNKWVDDIADTQTPDGRFNDTAPVGFVGTGAGWADAGMIIPWTLWKVYGDSRVLERHYEAMRSYVAYLRTQAPDLIGPNRGYGDWVAIGGITEKDLISTAYFAHVARLMEDIAGALGKAEDAAKYRQLFENIRSAFQKKFINPDGSIGAHKSQTAHLLALRFDLLTPAERAAAIPHLLANLDERNWRLGVGFLGVNLLLPTLTDVHHTDGAYYVITGTEFPSWGYSIAQGATTIWERWNSFTKARGFDTSGMNSFNHYAYGSCVEWLYRTVLGIDTLDAGFGRIVIRPEPGPGVTTARGHYDSIRGRIETAWAIENSQFALDVTLPPNTSAEICLPAKSPSEVSEGGKPATGAPGLKLARADDGSAIFIAGSGRYHFTVPYAGPPKTVPGPVPGKGNAAQEERGPEKIVTPKTGAALSLDTKIGDLLDSPAAHAVLQKYLPEALANPDFSQARSSTLREVHEFSPDYFSASRLEAIAAELVKISAPVWSVETTIIGDLLGNPQTRAVLAKHIPEAVENPDFAQARGMTLRSVQDFNPDYFTAARLKAIQGDLDKLNGSAAAATPNPAPAPTSKPATIGPLGIDSKIGDLLGHPAAKAVLAKYLGGMIDSPQFVGARGITLAELKPYVPQALTDEKLAAMAGELAKVGGGLAPAAAQKPAPGALSVDYKMGALLANAEAKAVLEKHLPKLMASSQIDQSRDLTLRELQKYFPDIVKSDKLDAINTDLAKAAGVNAPDAAAGKRPDAAATTAAQSWSVDSAVGALMDNTGAHAVLMKHLPEVFGNPQISAAREMKLRALQPYVPSMTDAVLAAMDLDLYAVPVPPGANVRVQPRVVSDPLQLKSVPLWANGAPGALGDRPSDKPSLTVVAPEAVQRNGAAVIVAPGGAYQALASNHEGRQVADWFAAHGVTAFVLTYRLIPFGYYHPTQLNDGLRAVRWVRAHAKEYGIDPDRVGMIGFSAGGHLTTMVATQGDAGNPNADDAVDRMSSKLNFMVLCYPGVMRTANLTSALLGPKPDPATEDQVFTEKHITKDTPPTFIFHTSDDELVAAERVVQFYGALYSAGVPVEMHVFEHGRHGMGLALNDPALRVWPVLLENWLDRRGLLSPQRAQK